MYLVDWGIRCIELAPFASLLLKRFWFTPQSGCIQALMKNTSLCTHSASPPLPSHSTNPHSHTRPPPDFSNPSRPLPLPFHRNLLFLCIPAMFTFFLADTVLFASRKLYQTPGCFAPLHSLRRTITTPLMAIVLSPYPNVRVFRLGALLGLLKTWRPPPCRLPRMAVHGD